MTRSRGKPSQEIDSESERTLRQRLKENQNQSTPKDQEAMENIEGTLDEQALRPRRTMEDFVTQSPNTNRTSIITPTIQANNFDFKPLLLLMKILMTILKDSWICVLLLSIKEPEEHLSKAWERFNGLLKKCPNHKIELWSQIEIFYDGLKINTRSMIDAAAGGSISKKTPEEVHELIEEMTANMYQYPMERSSKKAVGIYKLDSSTATQAQLEALQQQFANFQQQSNPVVASICGICGGGHADYECQRNVYALNSMPEQTNFAGNSRMMDPYSNTYNPGWKNHPNFSWNNVNQARQHPPGFKPIPTNIQQKEELLATKAELKEEKKLNQAMYTELQSLRYLKLGEPQETGITLQFADRSTKIPEGVMEDVLVKIQDFIYPCDFVVLDMEVDKNLPIILGRPFVATVGAIIDCKQGNLTLRLNNDTISFNIKEAMKQPAIPHDDFCLSIDVIDSCIAEFEEEERIEAAEDGGMIHSENENPIVSGEFGELEAKSEEELEEQGAPEAPKPELKPLPSNLKYVFLEKNNKPVIISLCLTGFEEKMLIEVLSKHKKAIGWSLSDIEGISPTICTHRILMEDNYKPSIQPQRRLNPTLQEVVKKEVIKLLDAGIIFPISDSAWVSLVQVVPKRGVLLSFIMKIMN
ncbi:hypothetical protein H6P81_010035 [Aristolochia fimbriata]|uniref:Retrotransposon gag domain-containing protein n=1 Tax=Aristolochia fimbriata TaxID=158543 RepID=A0AAV7EPP0_ARIFI|nr:hypothetical protein H6P81_010035 [Aristolochia fimbriata]